MATSWSARSPVHRHSGADAPQLNQGIKACFAQINERGGINGRRVGVLRRHDTYSGDGFAKAFAQAMQRKPVALLDRSAGGAQAPVRRPRCSTSPT